MPSRQRDDIVCFEVGSGEILPWIGSRQSLADDWAALKRQERRSSIRIAVRDDEVAIFGAGRVGLVVLPSGRHLILRSKIQSLTVLEWMIYLGQFPGLTSWLPEPGIAAHAIEGDDWHRCIGKLFLHALECITKQHIRKDYMALASNASEIRGRIVTTVLARRLHQLPRVPQIQRRRTLDTPFNIVLACALDRLPVMLAGSTSNDVERLARLRGQWASIRRDIHNPVASVISAQWASPPGYREALQLARLILIGAVLDPASNMGGQAFTISLARIWELGIRRMFDELCDSTGWIPAPEADRCCHWHDSYGADDRTRWMVADAMVQRDDIRWVLDAKYKQTFGNESRGDRFQMCAYALAFNADRVSLIHPTAATDKPESRILLQTTVGSKRITVDSMALPMAAGPEACKKALETIAGHDNQNHPVLAHDKVGLGSRVS